MYFFSILSLATAAKELNLICPEMLPSDEDTLQIVEGR